MTSGFASWGDLGRIDGNLLVVINSPEGAVDKVGALFDTLQRHARSGAIHVAASPSWRAWLSARGLADRALFSADDQGRELELNHFLESPIAVLWAEPKRFTAIVGTDPHSIYNEEVKQPFEQRACFLIGNGYFLAHTLPHPYVFVFDLAWLLERCARAFNVRRYERASRVMIDEFHDLWVERGRPSREDRAEVPELAYAVNRCLTPAMPAFDEDATTSARDGDLPEALVHVVSHLAALTRERDCHYNDRLQVMAAERMALIREWEASQRHATNLHTERVEAVNLRDEIIDDLRRQLEPFYRRLIRWLREPK